MMKAKIHWKTKAEGGRSALPLGTGSPPYATMVRFTGSNEPWPPENAWSLVVEKVEEPEPFVWLANVHFLVPEAPHESLSKGRTFELYEGPKCVASGETI
jgi:hypothetical protein